MGSGTAPGAAGAPLILLYERTASLVNAREMESVSPTIN